MKPPAARTRMDGAPSIVVMNSSARPPLIDVTPVANVLTPVGIAVPILPPTTPGVSWATWDARLPLSGASAICSARTVRPITDVSTSVAAASTWTLSVTGPTSRETSTLMLSPALTWTPAFVMGLKPESDAVILYSPTGTLGNVYSPASLVTVL